MAILAISAAFLASLLVPALCPAWQQRPDPVPQASEKDGCTTASDVRICRYDFSVDGRNVEAISFQPAGVGPFPGALLIPGYQRTAKNLVPLGTQLAAAGFAAVAGSVASSESVAPTASGRTGVAKACASSGIVSGIHRAAANGRLSGAGRLRLGGEDLIDYSAVRVKKRQARVPVGCDL